MWIVRLALSRPYTFIVMALVVILLTPVVLLRTPTDIFPEIQHPGHQPGLELQRAVAPRHGAAHHRELRTCSDHAGERR